MRRGLGPRHSAERHNRVSQGFAETGEIDQQGNVEVTNDFHSTQQGSPPAVDHGQHGGLNGGRLAASGTEADRHAIGGEQGVSGFNAVGFACVQGHLDPPMQGVRTRYGDHLVHHVKVPVLRMRRLRHPLKLVQACEPS